MKTKSYGKGWVRFWYPTHFRWKPLVYIINATNYSNPLGVGWWLYFWWFSFQIGVLFIEDWEDHKSPYDIRGENH